MYDKLGFTRHEEVKNARFRRYGYPVCKFNFVACDNAVFGTKLSVSHLRNAVDVELCLCITVERYLWPG